MTRGAIVSLATPEELNLSSYVTWMCTGIFKDEIFLLEMFI